MHICILIVYYHEHFWNIFCNFTAKNEASILISFYFLNIYRTRVFVWIKRFALFLVCGVTLNEESGEVLSPSYPQNYIRDIACSYTITQYPGKITSLTFVDFEVGSKVNDECVDDYVEVINTCLLIDWLIGVLRPFDSTCISTAQRRAFIF